eukprot:1490997-Alexandrium_andersonii.AAC.1
MLLLPFGGPRSRPPQWPTRSVRRRASGTIVGLGARPPWPLLPGAWSSHTVRPSAMSRLPSRQAPTAPPS